MAGGEVASVNVRMPPALLDKLVEDANARGTNLTSVAVGLLAEAYKVRYEPSNRRSLPERDGTVKVLLRMPPRLKEKIRTDAFKRRTNLTAAIVGVLCEHYDIPYTPSTRTVPYGGREAA